MSACGAQAVGVRGDHYLHGAQVKLVELYEQFGVDLGHWRKVSEVEDKKHGGKLVIAPPSALADKFTQVAGNYDVLCLRLVRSNVAKQRRVELPYHF